MSDKLLIFLGFEQFPLVPQLFYCKSKPLLIALVCKFVHDLLLTGENDVLSHTIQQFGSHLEFGTVVHGPNTLRYYVLNIF